MLENVDNFQDGYLCTGSQDTQVNSKARGLQDCLCPGLHGNTLPTLYDIFMVKLILLDNPQLSLPTFLVAHELLTKIMVLLWFKL